MSKLLISLEDRLISEAEFGLFFLYAKLTLKKAEELRKQGFIVTDSHENKGFPRSHKICWKSAGVYVFDYENIKSLNENNTEYTFAQRLWIISEKNQPSFEFLY